MGEAADDSTLKTAMLELDPDGKHFGLPSV
jgi:hypothetical protein